MNYGNFIGPAYSGRVQEVAHERCVNLYLEKTEVAGGKYEYALIGTPGTVNIPSWTFPGVLRGMYTASRDGRMYVVAGNKLYRMPTDESDPPAYLAPLSALDTPVQMVDDGRYLGIVDGSVLYVMDLTNTSAGFTTPLIGQKVKPNSIAFIQGITYVNNTYADPLVKQPLTSALMYFSNLGNMAQWYLHVEGVPDDPNAIQYLDGKSNYPVLRMIRTSDRIFAFSARAYEVCAPSGDPNIPLASVGGSLNDIGIYSAYSAAVLADKVFWLGTTIHGGLAVYRSNGYNAERISTHGIEYQLNKIDASNAIGWTTEFEGHKWYVLTMKGSNLSLVWDDTTGAWHEAASRVSQTDAQTIWDPIYATSVGKETYVGSALANRVLRLNLETYTEWDGRFIKRIRSGPILWDDLRLVRHVTLQLDMHTGNGLLNGQGKDPMVMMRFSDDAGQTWSDEDWSPSGRTGQYTSRVRWNRLGMAYSRIYEVTISDPVKVQIIGANVVTDTAPRQ